MPLPVHHSQLHAVPAGGRLGISRAPRLVAPGKLRAPPTHPAAHQWQQNVHLIKDGRGGAREARRGGGRGPESGARELPKHGGAVQTDGLPSEPYSRPCSAQTGLCRWSRALNRPACPSRSVAGLAIRERLAGRDGTADPSPRISLGGEIERGPGPLGQSCGISIRKPLPLPEPLETGLILLLYR